MVDIQEDVATWDQEAPTEEVFPKAMLRELPAPRAGYKNVGRIERIASGLLGTALAAYGMKRGSALGWALAALGGGLVFRGGTGHCDVYKALGIDTTNKESGCGC